MNTNDLLETATGMGYQAILGNSKNGEYVKTILRQGCSRKFNPAIGDLILWLMERGDLNLYGKIEGSFFNGIDEYLGFCSQSEKTLKENLLSIVLQVIRAEKEE